MNIPIPAIPVLIGRKWNTNSVDDQKPDLSEGLPGFQMLVKFLSRKEYIESVHQTNARTNMGFAVKSTVRNA